MAKKILIADDDPAVVKTVKAILENAHYDVIIASDGEECARKMVLDTPDLVLLDLMMPKMDGYSLLVSMKQLKALNANIPDIPVIVITAREDALAKELVGKENIKGYILKPFDIQELLGKISELLK